MVVTPARTCVILPVKTFAQGKTRLRAQLSDHARAGLARDMFLGVLHASQHCADLAATYVVTNGADVAELVHRNDTKQPATVLRDPRPNMTLGALMDWAIAEVAQRGATRALILMADLPALEIRDLNALCAALDEHDCVLVPDRRGLSTNALGLRLPFVGQTAFGEPDSFARHSAHMAKLALRVRVLLNGRIAHDVDIPDDLLTAPTPLDECHGDVAGKQQGW
ncbi:MAG TPA: 2-phospho-L-lactate guanylyltransferase [Polyangiales bacterium]|nr:2-phospho-L-lactate guanylyltransferase [Polyangiales bacterium]